VLRLGLSSLALLATGPMAYLLLLGGFVRMPSKSRVIAKGALDGQYSTLGGQ